MKVKEVVEMLQKEDQDATLVVRGEDRYFYDISNATGDGTVKEGLESPDEDADYVVFLKLVC